MSSTGVDHPSGGPEWIDRGFDAITVVAAEKQVACDFDGEAVILELNKGMYYGLNPVATRVWDLVQNPITAREIRTALLTEFDVEQGRCETELIALLEEMSNRGLIEIRGGSKT